MKNALVLLVVLAMAVAACGDSSSDEEADPVGNDTESVASPAGSADGTPVPEGSTTAPPDGSTAPETPTTTEAADLPEPAAGTEGTEVPPPPAAEMMEMDSLIAMAKADLAARLGIPVDQISLREAREVTWPDTSLGCPEAGMAYSQVLTPGLLIRLSAGGEMYSYHAGGDRDPFLCEQTSIVPEPTIKEDEFVPPPGSETD